MLGDNSALFQTLHDSCSLSDITKKQNFFKLKASPMDFVCDHPAEDCWECTLLAQEHCSYSKCYCTLVILTEFKQVHRVIFPKHICLTENVFAVVLIILI